MAKNLNSNTIQQVFGIPALFLALGILLSTGVQACPDGWVCMQGKACPPIENCLAITVEPAPEPPAISTPPEEYLPSSPIEEDPLTPVPEEPPTTTTICIP